MPLPFHSGRQPQWAAIEVGLSTVRGNTTPGAPYGMALPVTTLPISQLEYWLSICWLAYTKHTLTAWERSVKTDEFLDVL